MTTKIPLELSAYAPTASGATLELQTTDTTVTDGSVLGKIEFKAPSEASGTDAILVGAAIEAVAEGTFAADNNATELLFKTGASEAATTKMTIDSSGNVGIGTSTPSTGYNTNRNNLVVYDASAAGITINSNATDGSSIISMTDGTGTLAGEIHYVHDGDSMRFNTATAEAMRIDSDGNVHLGYAGDTWHGDYTAITGPNFSLSCDTAAGASKGVTLGYNAYVDSGNAWTYMNADEASLIQQFNGTMYFYTAAAGSANADITFTEKMRINNAGSVGIGATSDASSLTSNLFVTGTGNAFSAITSSSSGATVAAFKTGSYDGASNVMNFYNAGNGVMGRITATNGNSGTAVTYTATSDYRLKENITPIKDGLERLNNLKPVKFDWKDDGTSSEGFIAHEAQEVFPDAVTGEKDGEEMQGMDYGRITPLLVKAIQEQQEQIEQLKTEIQTLKGE